MVLKSGVTCAEWDEGVVCRSGVESGVDKRSGGVGRKSGVQEWSAGLVWRRGVKEWRAEE